MQCEQLFDINLEIWLPLQIVFEVNTMSCSNSRVVEKFHFVTNFICLQTISIISTQAKFLNIFSFIIYEDIFI